MLNSTEDRVKNRAGHRTLDTKQVLELYKQSIKELGFGNSRWVAEKLGELGVIIPWTGKPPSPEAVLYHLHKTEEGRRLLKEFGGKGRFKG